MGGLERAQGPEGPEALLLFCACILQLGGSLTPSAVLSKLARVVCRWLPKYKDGEVKLFSAHLNQNASQQKGHLCSPL